MFSIGLINGQSRHIFARGKQEARLKAYHEFGTNMVSTIRMENPIVQMNSQPRTHNARKHKVTTTPTKAPRKKKVTRVYLHTKEAQVLHYIAHVRGGLARGMIHPFFTTAQAIGSYYDTPAPEYQTAINNLQEEGLLVGECRDRWRGENKRWVYRMTEKGYAFAEKADIKQFDVAVSQKYGAQPVKEPTKPAEEITIGQQVFPTPATVYVRRYPLRVAGQTIWVDESAVESLRQSIEEIASDIKAQAK